MRLSIILAGLVLIAGVAFAVDRVSDNGTKSYSWRYKMTVEVETPEGLKSGSAVREVDIKFLYHFNPGSNSQYVVRASVIGEAVVVDLGARGAAFAVLPSGAYLDVTQTIEGPPPLTLEGEEYYSSLAIGTKANMTPDHYPWLYTFTDLNDPMSVKLVKGGRFNVKQQKNIMEDNFESIFGQGVTLKSVSVEITDEPITWGIEKWLPWLPERKNIKGYLGGNSKPPYDDPTKTYLNGVEFSRGKFGSIRKDNKNER